VFLESKKKSVYLRSYQKLKFQNEIIGKNIKILKAKEQIEKAKNLRILFTGETGVGKTPFAWYSNQVLSKEENSPRPFEQLNCAGLNTLHFEDILFGHKKGAFTGAMNDKKGLVEIAKGGDLFLDEIGELNLETQSRFLTFLDTYEYYRLGDDQKRKASVRILCATNRDLRGEVEKGNFRKDLFSRIAQVEVPIVPLRERMEDFVLLFEYFIKKFAGFSKPYTPALVQRLKQFSWQEGNVRELSALVEYLCVISKQVDTLDTTHLSEKYQTIQKVEDSNSLSFGLENYLGNIEKKVLEECVRESSHLTVEELADKLKVSKPTLYRRMKKYEINYEKD
jgi:transcriptional regulator with PAS, ATPase and Fis domain